MLNVDKILRAKGLTKTELAEKMSLSRNGVHRILTGNPTLANLIKMADVLDVPVSSLFDEPSQINSLICPHCSGKIKIGITIEGLQ